MTRGRVHEIMVQSFTHCEIAIKRKPHLEKLLTAGRSAKIVNRRKTIAVDGASQSPNPLTKSVLFKNISNKPFTTRRNSVKSRSIGHTTDTVSNQEVLSVMVDMSRKENVPPELSVSEYSLNLSSNNQSLQTECISTLDIINDSSTEDFGMNSNEIVSMDELSIDVVGNIMDSSKTSENDNEILLPSVPVPEYDKQHGQVMKMSPILNDSIPDLLNLPDPLQPNPTTTNKRSKTAQYILNLMDEYESGSVNTVIPKELLNLVDIDIHPGIYLF